MPCAIPIRIINPHYKKIAEELNEDVSLYEDRHDFYLDVPCGQCINCLRSKGNAWSLRLQLEYKYLSPVQKNNSFFLTMTLSPEYYDMDKSLIIRRFLERVRKRCGRSVKHWIINEYGETTGRYHFHGLFFDLPFPRREFLSYWKYGHIATKPLTPRRIGYLTTYVTKNLRKTGKKFVTPDLLQDPNKKQKIWCSPGLGKAVANDPHVTSHLHVNDRPTPFMYNPSNHVTAIPRYLRGKFFTDDEREDLQQRYYANLSEDVIPPPPYRIGYTFYKDYTIYLRDCEQLRRLKNKQYYKYVKQFTQPSFETTFD